ncbi:hypothetical protein D9Q98_002667 [Chlorella vulgaris]|uniref:Protein kinase domain-containing protein n=1 Tax=Chlorella vulgaris TaxID=3077 RepID=A0A9D4TTN9_CHLVU|nr:hypothetical protein D9Q98_002667 [Chlorella vulgaris]
MQPLLVLVIVLPPILLLLGIAVGVAGAHWWWARHRAAPSAGKAATSGDIERGTSASLAPLTGGKHGLGGTITSIHIIASGSLSSDANPSSRGASSQLSPLRAASASASPPLAHRLARPPAIRTPDPMQPDDVGEELAGLPAGVQRRHASLASLVQGASSSMSPLAGLTHRKTLSLDFGQLVRAGPAAINQVMENWEARSTLYRLMSMDAGGGAATASSSPHAAAAAAAAARLLSPGAAALFSPITNGGRGGGGGTQQGGGSTMPKGEVHMDEIDLIECIGKGGYGCVYKASWRGAGVAVKYIVCPTDDADSLGRAIREVVLSRKMSHPNVVQCYSWTVLTESDGHCRTPGSHSGRSSPAEQSFTGGRQRMLRQLAAAGSGARSRRTSLDLLRPAAPGSARRGLDHRFSSAAAAGAVPSCSGAPRSPGSLALHRISEHPLQEGRSTTQQEAEAPLWLHAAAAAAAAGAGGGGAGAAAGWRSLAPHQLQREVAAGESVVEDLVAEAAAELEQGGELSLHWGGNLGSPADQQQSPPALHVATTLIAVKPQLKLGLAPLNSCSPSGSPGIQAVHDPQLLLTGGAHAEAMATGSCMDGPDQLQPSHPQHQFGEPSAALSLTLEPSPFATGVATHPPLVPTGSGPPAATGEALCNVSAMAEQPRQATTDGEEGQDVYARFGSYQEMVAHFQGLAAEGEHAQQQLSQQQETGQTRQREQAASVGIDISGGGLGGGLAGHEYDMTAASSFSDVVSLCGFMLEGSASLNGGLELSFPPSSQHSSPHHRQHHPQHQRRASHGSWLPPSSAGSSRGSTPRAGSSAAGASSFWRLSRAAPWAASRQQQQQQQSQQRAQQADTSGHGSMGLEAALAASMPQPAWWQAGSSSNGIATAGHLAGGTTAAAALAARQLSSESIAPRPDLGAAATAAGVAAAAAADGAAEEPHAQEQVIACRGSSGRDVQQLAAEPSGGLRSLLGSLHCSSTISLNTWHPAAGAAATPPCGASLDCTGRPAGSCPAPSAAAAEAEPSSSRQCESSPGSGTQQHELLVPALRLSLSSAGASASVTPRLGSLYNLAPSAAATAAPDSLPVTPRQHSLRGSKHAPAGLLRVEELRAEAAASAAALGGGGGGGDGAPASADRLSFGSHNDSFNSEEGFGSPVKQRRGGVQDVFLLEELALSGQEALMVVVMEYCDLGSLRKALKRGAFRPSTKWPFQTTYRALLRTAQEVAKGMGYIHEFNIVHGDLKPGNVLLKTHKVDRRGYIAKVADFGLSRALDFEDMHGPETTLGTIAYTAPETFASSCLQKPADVYAFGIMLWEMFYCRDPYEGLMDGQICVGVTDGSLRPEFEADCPEPYRRLAERCWHQDPGRRPGFEEVDAELVRVEMEFRLACHRTATNSKRASATSAGGGSVPSSRPSSPQPRGAAAAPRRQFQAAVRPG